MERIKWLVQTINFRIVSYVAAAIALLYAITLPVIIDPLFGFLLAGIVPGTDIVLAPDTILVFLLNAAGLFVVFMLVRWILRRRARASANRLPIAAPIKKASPATAAIRTTPKAVKAPRAAASHSLMYRVLNHLSRVLVALVDVLVDAMIKAGQIQLFGLKKTIAGMVWMAVFFIVTLGTAIDLSLRIMSRIWVWALPHLRLIDSWLEIQFRSVEKYIQKRLKQSESMQVFMTVCKDSVANVRRLIGR